MADKGYETDFSKISSIEDLKSYLNDHSSRLKNRTSFYHYTKLDRVIDIYKSKKWFLGKAENMNDRVEYSNGDPKRWENIFFASFMTDIRESIGMWSMYAQPWEDGVLISIPKKLVLDWIKKAESIYEISGNDHKTVGEKITLSKGKEGENRLFLSSVAYSNYATHNDTEDTEKLIWSNKSNTNIKGAPHIPELTGYIKDSAWDYEREIRIKAVLKDGFKYSCVALPIPEDVLDSITITSGPMFEGDLKERLREKIETKIKVSKSLFSKKLIISNTCSNCEYKKAVNK